MPPQCMLVGSAIGYTFTGLAMFNGRKAAGLPSPPTALGHIFFWPVAALLHGELAFHTCWFAAASAQSALVIAAIGDPVIGGGAGFLSLLLAPLNLPAVCVAFALFLAAQLVGARKPTWLPQRPSLPTSVPKEVQDEATDFATTCFEFGGSCSSVEAAGI